MKNYFYKNILFPIIDRGSFSAINSFYDKLIADQYMERSMIEDIKFYKMKNMVVHAFNNTEFYKKRFIDFGISPQNIKSFDDFKKIPVLTRDDINQNLDQLIAKNYRSNEIHYSTTGGSTGKATKFARNNTSLSIKKANEYRFNRFSDWEFGEKILYYWPALKDFSKNQKEYSFKHKYLKRELMLYSGQLNGQVLNRHFDIFKKFQPDLIRAFPSSLQVFAEYLQSKNLKFGIKRGIYSVGEPLNKYQRKIFEDTFACKVFNCYVSRECGNIACECQQGQGLHVAEDLLNLDIYESNEDGYGDILLTDFCNFGMPFIKYKINDFTRFVESKCSCGRNFHLIEIDGARESDYLISSLDSSFICPSAMVHYLLAENPSIGKMKIIQNSINKLDIQVACSRENEKTFLAHLEKVIGELFKGTMNIEFHFVQEIPLLPSGKYQFIQRNVNKDTSYSA